jgi:hypothetical protein
MSLQVTRSHVMHPDSSSLILATMVAESDTQQHLYIDAANRIDRVAMLAHHDRGTPLAFILTIHKTTLTVVNGRSM